MFDRTFVPYLIRSSQQLSEDPLDDCMRETFDQMVDEIAHLVARDDVDSHHSFDKGKNNKHTLSCQVAASVCRATRLYTKDDLDQEGKGIYKSLAEADGLPAQEEAKIFPVCLHPRYGGWFSIRGVLIFKNILCETIPTSQVVQVLTSQSEIAHLLHLWNNHGMDWRYR